MKLWKGFPIDEEDAMLSLTETTFSNMTLDHEPSKPFQPMSAIVLEPYIPINYKDAISCPDSLHWKEGIHDEYNSLLENKTWDIVPLPQGRKPIKCKWILDYKPEHNGIKARYKARLVACGYAQLYGIDYLDTYSPVIKHYSIRLVLGLVAVMDLEMTQLDIKTAFLYGTLEEEIYMRQPEGFVLPGREEEVCRLRKSIYGLKQASKCWNTTFDKFIMEFGLTRSKSDSCLYYRCGPEGEFTILIIYVDDGLVCSNKPNVLTEIIDHLNIHFKVRTLPPSRFVGLDIVRDRPNRKLYINQTDFIHKILRRYNMEGCNPVSIPADPNNRPNKTMEPKTESERYEMEKIPMREAVGSLMYLMAMTRADIALAVNQVAAFTSNPGLGHWKAVKQIFAYLAGTTQYGICFGENTLDQNCPLQGYTDANFADDTKARKSTTGTNQNTGITSIITKYFFSLNRNSIPIPWWTNCMGQ